MPFQGDGIDAGQTPFLSGGVENVRRCADLQCPQQRILIVPRVETVRADPDRDVKIKADRQAARGGSVAAATKLLVRDPLHVFMKPDAVSLGGTRSTQYILVRPFPPGFLEAAAQMFEAGEPGEN